MTEPDFAQLETLLRDERSRCFDKGDAPRRRDAWLCGYAAALGAAMRLHGEASLVESVIRCDGLSPEQLKRAGAEAFDMRQIRRAWTKRKGDAKKGHVKL